MKLNTFLVFLFSILLSVFSQAQTLQELQQQGLIDIKAWIEPDTNIAPKQQLLYVIDVGTSTWFTGGTKIGRIDVESLMAIQRNKLATNYSERKNGASWARQRWEITLYPLASGEYAIPPVSVKVSVSGENRKKVSGTLLTKPVSFATSLPSAELTQERKWLVASSIEVNQVWNIEEAQELNVGDAVIREVSITAKDSTSALIPAFQTDAVSSELGRYYLTPPNLTDSQPRGNYSATRSEKITFIAQGSGEFVAPDIELLWWNTEANQLETLVIEGKTISISHTPMSWLKNNAALLTALIISLFIILVFIKQLIHYYKTHPTPAIIAFISALFRGNTKQARLHIYKRLRTKTGELAVTEHLTTDDSSEPLITAWQQEYKDKTEIKTNALFKIWTRIKDNSVKQKLLSPAIPELEKYKNTRESYED